MKYTDMLFIKDEVNNSSVKLEKKPSRVIDALSSLFMSLDLCTLPQEKKTGKWIRLLWAVSQMHRSYRKLQQKLGTIS